VLTDYVEIIELVAPTTVPRVVPGDVDDDQVIAAAVAAQGPPYRAHAAGFAGF
jgi:hypothetical protein